MALSLLLAAAEPPRAQAEELDSIQVGAMYMAYFGLDVGTGVISWSNPDDYPLDGPQVLRPLSLINGESVPPKDDHYVGSGPWVDLLNPHEYGGVDAASSRLFGFSLSGAFRSYLNTQNYALAIRLDSITYAGGNDPAENTSVFYYNRGDDDWGSYHEDKVEWSELDGSKYLIWNGQSFSNMIHPLVVTTDAFAADYELTYTLSIVQDITGANVNATVVDAVSLIPGISPLTFSYTAQSVGATAVPEPASMAILMGGGALLWIVKRRRSL